MAEIVDPLIYGACVLVFLVAWRWLWLRRERRKLARMPSAFEEERFDPETDDDEYDKLYSGRLIKRLRARVVEGRIEIHWQFNEGFSHRGFVLTGKCRRNDGEWQPLAFEPFEDSGSWIECFNRGESRSYLFTVKKKSWFFFGLFGEEPDEVPFDQISFSARKGKYLKERTELINERTDFVKATTNYGNAMKEARKVWRQMNAPDAAPKIPETKIDKLQRRLKEKRDLADHVEKQIAEIKAHPTWSEERKKKEIEDLEKAFEEMDMGE